jgi:hypothetical protein
VKGPWREDQPFLRVMHRIPKCRFTPGNQRHTIRFVMIFRNGRQVNAASDSRVRRVS